MTADGGGKVLFHGLSGTEAASSCFTHIDGGKVCCPQWHDGGAVLPRSTTPRAREIELGKLRIGNTSYVGHGSNPCFPDDVCSAAEL